MIEQSNTHFESLPFKAQTEFRREVKPELVAMSGLYANLLVVKLHVKPYNPRGEESRAILPPARRKGPRTAKEAGVLPGGHDVLRVLDPSLAADRSGQAHHGDHPSADMRGVRDHNGQTGTWPR